MTRHPSDAALRAWAAGSREDLTFHIEDCDRCLSELETLTGLHPGFRNALQSITRPDPGLVSRLGERLEQRRRDAETWSVVAGLFGLGWQTLDALRDRDIER